MVKPELHFAFACGVEGTYFCVLAVPKSRTAFEQIDQIRKYSGFTQPGEKASMYAICNNWQVPANCEPIHVAPAARI